MQEDGQPGSVSGTGIASQTQRPGEAGVSALFTSEDRLFWFAERRLQRSRLPGEGGRVSAHERKDASAQRAARPLSPEKRRGCGQRDRWGSRRRGSGQRISRNGPNHGADPTRRCGGRMLVTRLPERAPATKADAASRHDGQRAIVFRSTLVRGKRTISGTTQGAVRVEGKSRTRKPARTRACGPLRRTRDHRRGWLTECDWRTHMSWSTFGGAHGGGSQMLAAFQPQLPEPRGQGLKTFLSERRARDPTIRVLFLIFVGENGLKGPTMPGQIEHVFGAERRSRQGRDEPFGDHPRPSLTH